jgi:hypothetical protein
VRRPEILRLFESIQFGKAPGKPAKVIVDRFDTGTVALGGKAIRRQTTLYFTDDRNGPKAELLSYVPADAKGPVPLLLQISFSPTASVVADSGIKPGEMWSRDKKRVPAPRGGAFGRVDPLPFLANGIGFATLYYGDIEPDFKGGIPFGIRGRYLKPGQTQPAPDEWGAIAAWGWGASRVIDYFETDPQIDAKRIALTGASRLGKTALWAAARDQRIACVIASVSGEGGAARSRRDYGETVAHLVAPTRYPYQFAGNYKKWAGRSGAAPFDGHMIVALVAPRAVLLQTGSTDKWSDPYGEFLAAKAATPVFELLGKKGIEQYSQPATGHPLMNTLGYLMHNGPHGVRPEDWPVFLDFLGRHL